MTGMTKSWVELSKETQTPAGGLILFREAQWLK
jgi:hypothetical protein